MTDHHSTVRSAPAPRPSSLTSTIDGKPRRAVLNARATLARVALARAIQAAGERNVTDLLRNPTVEFTAAAQQRARRTHLPAAAQAAWQALADAGPRAVAAAAAAPASGWRSSGAAPPATSAAPPSRCPPPGQQPRRRGRHPSANRSRTRA
jgi:hypothetical protein